MINKEMPILIIGGGIGGLATALALARKGYASRVLEQALEFKEIGAGIQLGPNVFKMFSMLGLADEVLSLAVLPENLIMMDPITREEVTRLPLGKEFIDRFKFPYALIHRADLLTTLVKACQRSDLITLENSRRVVGFVDHGDHVSVSTKTGLTYEEEGPTYKTAALVGADGLWSTIRSMLLNDGPPKACGHIAYRAVLPTQEVPERLRYHSMVLWAGEKTHLVHYPLRGGELFNLVAVFHSNRYEEGWDTYGDPTELHERFAGKCEEVQVMISKIESWRMWVLCDRKPVKYWSRGRVALLGDAAHPVLQYLAQGACMAVEDAVCMADQIEKAGGDFERAFKAYEQMRYLRTARVQIMARLYGDVYHASGVEREVRNQMLANRSPKDGYESLAWLYD